MNKRNIFIFVVAVHSFCGFSLFAQDNDNRIAQVEPILTPLSKSALQLNVTSRAEKSSSDNGQARPSCACPSKPYGKGALVLIDGIEVPNSFSISRLEPKNIKDFSVQKGAEAIENYGEKGVNGVVIVNTVLGKKNTKKMIKKYEKLIKKTGQNIHNNNWPIVVQ